MCWLCYGVYLQTPIVRSSTLTWVFWCAVTTFEYLVLRESLLPCGANLLVSASNRTVYIGRRNYSRDTSAEVPKIKKWGFFIIPCIKWDFCLWFHDSRINTVFLMSRRVKENTYSKLLEIKRYTDYIISAYTVTLSFLQYFFTDGKAVFQPISDLTESNF